MNPPLLAQSVAGGVDARRLDALRFDADPLADRTIASIMGPAGPWVIEPGQTGDLIALNHPRFQRMAAASRAMSGWTENGLLDDWQPPADLLAADVAAAMREYLRSASVLPVWADRARIERAERIFFEYGPLSCALLFCASLPECYVSPDLADVLHAAGQLEQHTDYRIRMTAAMIFPVMMRGGLTDPRGAGIAQVLKVRLIHATIRHLILRGRPEDAGESIVPLSALARSGQMYHALFGHGWNVREKGLPCNQEELAYTLLTFSYVFVRSLRQLGLGLSREDEEAYLHCWNVAAHLLGVRRELMADTMEEAESLFTVMQARANAHPPSPDVRPNLGRALMNAMATSIRLPIVRDLPPLLTAHLCGPRTSTAIGANGQARWPARLLFAVVMGVSGIVDAVMRVWWPDFALSRLITRILGYHVVTAVLLDQTRPLTLPEHLLNRIDEGMAGWHEDPKAPRFVNAVEDALTIRGSWRRRVRTSIQHI
ncbi:MAG: oxygenase MpaB family protein [Vicinamibacterales bacterium]